MNDPECIRLLRWALPRLELRWEGFRKPRRQVCRRIRRRMDALGLAGTDAYRRHLVTDPGEWSVLEALCRVTISRFYRDRGVWRHLEERALPELAREVAGGSAPRVLRAWSAGCASGEEPYTLAILWRLGLQASHPAVRLEVVATDADPVVLARARKGCYPPGALRDLPAPWREAAFVGGGADREDPRDALCLRSGLREGVTFLRQDFRREAPPGPFHLVLCRNLAFTYFGPEAMGAALGALLERLPPGGRLVLGAHEALPAGGPWPLVADGTAEPVFRRTRSPEGL